MAYKQGCCRDCKFFYPDSKQDREWYNDFRDGFCKKFIPKRRGKKDLCANFEQKENEA